MTVISATRSHIAALRGEMQAYARETNTHARDLPQIGAELWQAVRTQPRAQVGAAVIASGLMAMVAHHDFHFSRARFVESEREGSAVVTMDDDRSLRVSDVFDDLIRNPDRARAVARRAAAALNEPMR